MSKIHYLAAAALAVSAFSAQADSVAGCTGSQSSAVSNATPFGASGEPRPNGTFVKSGFGVSCSAKVNLQYSEASANAFYVAAGSSKGNQAFHGNSAAGGTIVVAGKCDATAGCTTEVGSALSSAANLGSS